MEGFKKGEASLLDTAIAIQVVLERLKVGQLKGIEDAAKNITSVVRSQLNGMSADLKGQSKRVVSRSLARLKKSVDKTLRAYNSDVESTLKSVPGVFVGLEKEALATTIGAVTLSTPQGKKLFQSILKTPMGHSGELVADYLTALSTNESKRIVNTVTRGIYQGRTNQQIVREIVGTQSRRFKDGTLAVFRRNTTAVTFTAIQHAASVARMELWKANADVVGSYRWVSTLDSRTTSQCRSLDGQVFEFNAGPVPPIHTRCRSTTVAVLSEEFDFLSRGRTRSGEFGYVPANQMVHGSNCARAAAIHDGYRMVFRVVSTVSLTHSLSLPACL